MLQGYSPDHGPGPVDDMYRTSASNYTVQPHVQCKLVDLLENDQLTVDMSRPQGQGADCIARNVDCVVTREL